MPDFKCSRCGHKAIAYTYTPPEGRICPLFICQNADCGFQEAIDNGVTVWYQEIFRAGPAKEKAVSGYVDDQIEELCKQFDLFISRAVKNANIGDTQVRLSINGPLGGESSTLCVYHPDPIQKRLDEIVLELGKLDTRFFSSVAQVAAYPIRARGPEEYIKHSSGSSWASWKKIVELCDEVDFLVAKRKFERGE